MTTIPTLQVEARLRLALDTVPSGVCTVRQNDLAAVLTLLAAVRDCANERGEALERLQSETTAHGANTYAHMMLVRAEQAEADLTALRAKIAPLVERAQAVVQVGTRSALITDLAHLLEHERDALAAEVRAFRGETAAHGSNAYAHTMLVRAERAESERDALATELRICRESQAVAFARVEALTRQLADLHSDECENGHTRHEDCTDACACVGSGKSEVERLKAEVERLRGELESAHFVRAKIEDAPRKRAEEELAALRAKIEPLVARAQDWLTEAVVAPEPHQPANAIDIIADLARLCPACEARVNGGAE